MRATGPISPSVREGHPYVRTQPGLFFVTYVPVQRLARREPCLFGWATTYTKR